MTIQKKIRLKALLLTIVFSLNTIAGLACSFESISGADKNTSVSNGHKHADAKLPQLAAQNQASKPLKPGSYNAGNETRCCNDQVVQFAKADKLIPQSSGLAVSAVITLVPFYHSIDLLFTSQKVGSIKYFVRSYHPPITDIRIAVQSFQI